MKSTLTLPVEEIRPLFPQANLRETLKQFTLWGESFWVEFLSLHIQAIKNQEEGVNGTTAETSFLSVQ